MKRLAFPLFLLTLSLSGCLGGDGTYENQVRVGDEFAYRLDDDVISQWRIGSVETLDFIGRSPCMGLVIESASSTSTGETQFCLDQTLHKEHVTEREHPHTGDLIRSHFFGGSFGVFTTLALCAIACEEFAEDLKWQWEHPPSQYGEATIESIGNESYRYQSVLHHRGATEFTNLTFNFSEGKWPSEIVHESVRLRPFNDPGDKRFEQTLIWERIDEAEGRGEPVRFSKVEEGVYSALEGSSWTQFPKTGGAPFEYTIEQAYEDLKSNIDGLLWLEEHPEAFVAAARYGVWEDVEDPRQHEYTWNLVWADGQDRLTARCHRLVQDTPLMDLATDQSCWQVDTFEEEEPIHRSDYAAETLDWGGLYQRWKDIGGKTLPINNAYWTIYDEPPNIASASNIKGEVADRFTAEFNFYPGTFDSASDSPNWVVLPPGGQSHAHPVAASIFDPVDGRPYLVSTPLE